MQQPLDFQKFFVKNIQKIKNGLRPSPPCFARSLPLRGSREAADNFCRKSFCGKNCFQEIVTNRKSAKIILRSYTKVKYGLAQTILMR